MVQELSTMLELSEQLSCSADEEGSAGGKSASFSVLLQYPERRLLFARIAACLSSDNSLVCQAALRLWSVPGVTSFFRRYWKEVLDHCWVPLSQSAARHWNATCKRQTGVVLGIILKDARAESGAVQWLPGCDREGPRVHVCAPGAVPFTNG